MVIVKLQSDHAKRLYENAIYIQTADNLNFKVHLAKTRRVIKTSKKTSWQNYVNRLNSSSKSKKVWDMIRKISGKNKSSPINHLSKNHVKATNKKDIADLLAKTFSTNSSSDNYSEQFQNIKGQVS